MLETLLSGAVTGFLGGVVGKVFDYKSKKLDKELSILKFNQEVELRKVDLELMKEEWNQRIKVATVEAEAKVEVADSAAFNTSLTVEPKKYYDGPYSGKQAWLMVAVDFLRGIIRPFLTIYLCLLTTLIYIQAKGLLTMDIILPGMAYSLVEQIINTVLYLCVTVVCWWFGSRGTKAPKLK